MAEIAARADAKIGLLYRFFPNKEAVADALMRHHAEILQAEYDAIRARAAGAMPEELADILIDLLVTLHPRTRALTALLDARTDWTTVRQRFRGQALAGIKTALTACAPNLDDKEADDIAAVVLNNMKTMVGMTMKGAPTSLGAPEELRLMNRLYLTVKLAPAGLPRSDRPANKSPRIDRTTTKNPSATTVLSTDDRRANCGRPQTPFARRLNFAFKLFDDGRHFLIGGHRLVVGYFVFGRPGLLSVPEAAGGQSVLCVIGLPKSAIALAFNGPESFRQNGRCRQRSRANAGTR